MGNPRSKYGLVSVGGKTRPFAAYRRIARGRRAGWVEVVLREIRTQGSRPTRTWEWVERRRAVPPAAVLRFPAAETEMEEK